MTVQELFVSARNSHRREIVTFRFAHNEKTFDIRIYEIDLKLVGMKIALRERGDYSRVKKLAVKSSRELPRHIFTTDR